MYGATFFEKLLDDDMGSAGHATVASVKRSVAADVEALLNCRRGLTDEALRPYPISGKSLLSFGIHDFSSCGMGSVDDLDGVCSDIRQAIILHEPRLVDPIVSINVGAGYLGRKVSFSIKALLLIHELEEAVSFDAVLQPNTLQYSVLAGR
jgi:type VI secretion system protein ImpF